MALDYDDGFWDDDERHHVDPEPDDYTEEDRFFYEYSDRGADYENDRMLNRFDERASSYYKEFIGDE